MHRRVGLGLTGLRRKLILPPEALQRSEVRPPTPGTSSARFLQLQCTFASLRAQWRSEVRGQGSGVRTVHRPLQGTSPGVLLSSSLSPTLLPHSCGQAP